MFSLPFAPDERFALHFKAQTHCPFDGVYPEHSRRTQGRLSPGRVCPRPLSLWI